MLEKSQVCSLLVIKEQVKQRVKKEGHVQRDTEVLFPLKSMKANAVIIINTAVIINSAVVRGNEEMNYTAFTHLNNHPH